VGERPQDDGRRAAPWRLEAELAREIERLTDRRLALLDLLAALYTGLDALVRTAGDRRETDDPDAEGQGVAQRPAPGAW
jgi:hypothetical protein